MFLQDLRMREQIFQKQPMNSVKKRKMAPGEMECVPLTPAMIEKMNDQTTIAVVEE